jgi:hypothetical protein
MRNEGGVTQNGSEEKASRQVSDTSFALRSVSLMMDIWRPTSLRYFRFIFRYRPISAFVELSCFSCGS